jgi:hypothetical protein
MTRTAAADAVVPGCPHAAAACPAAAGDAIAFTVPGPGNPVIRRPGRPGQAGSPLLRHLPGVLRQPDDTQARPLGRLSLPGNAVTPARWPADPGRDLS